MWAAGRIVDGVREPVVAGIYYESDPERLRAQLDTLFRDVDVKGSCTVGAVLAPHAGYIYSGRIAAYAFRALASGSKPETVVIVAPNHTGLGAPISVFPGRFYRTPLGDVRVDEEVSRLLAERIRGAVLEPYAHLYEHSVEVQLPMLQYVYGGSPPKVAAIVLSQAKPEVAERVAAVLAELTVEGRAAVVFTSNMTQFKPEDEVRRLDAKLLEAVRSVDVEALMEVVREGANPCGLPPLMVLVSYARRVGGRVEVLAYATSSDVGGSRSLAVGYAALRVCRG